MGDQQSQPLELSFNNIDLQIAVSDMLKKARIKKGFSQVELASLLGTSRSTIAKAEAGDFMPTLKFLQNVAQNLGATLAPPVFDFPHENSTVSTNSSGTFDVGFNKSEKRAQIVSSEYFVGVNYD